MKAIFYMQENIYAVLFSSREIGSSFEKNRQQIRMKLVW